jgi:hypothetical protein
MQFAEFPPTSEVKVGVETKYKSLDNVLHSEYGLDALKSLLLRVKNTYRSAHRHTVPQMGLATEDIILLCDAVVKILAFAMTVRFPCTEREQTDV